MSKEQNTFQGELIGKKGERISVNTPIVIFEQNNCKIIFSPTLEIYGYGNNEKEAKQSFKNNVEEFINYTINKGTFTSELKRMGWEYKKRRKQYIVPSFSKMLKSNEKLIDILDHNQAVINQQAISLPMA